MNGRSLISLGLVIVVALLVGLAFASDQTASESIPGVFQMKSDYPHKKSISSFTHEKHIEEYELTCGQCHHDDQGQPLDELKMTDQVQGCMECHKEPGERPKGKDAPKLTKEERLAYHAEALHYNCKGCHKAHNKKHKTKAAPTTCIKCHPKGKPAAPTGLVIKG